MNWQTKDYQGNPQFQIEPDGSALTIINDSADDQGSIYAWYEGPIAPDEQYRVAGQWGIGKVVVVFQLGPSSYAGINVTDDNRSVTVPAGAQRMRLDCRLWNQAGTAVFTGMSIEQASEPAEPGEPEPPAEPPIWGDMPIPMPATDEHILGYLWNGSYFLQDINEAIPGTFGTPHEVKGWRHGRIIILEIGHPFYADLEPTDTPEEPTAE